MDDAVLVRVMDGAGQRLDSPAASARWLRACRASCSARLGPSTNSSARKGWPSCSPTSKICTMFGCCRRRRRLRLAAESLAGSPIAQVDPGSTFERHAPVHRLVHRLVHHAHAAASHLSHNAIQP